MISEELIDEINLLTKQDLWTLFAMVAKKAELAYLHFTKADVNEAWWTRFPDINFDDEVWAAVKCTQGWDDFPTDSMISRGWDRLDDIVREAADNLGIQS